MGWAWPGLISAIGRCMPLISPHPLLWCNWIRYLLRWRATQKTCNEVICSVADGSMRGPFRPHLCNTGAWQACLPATFLALAAKTISYLCKKLHISKSECRMQENFRALSFYLYQLTVQWQDLLRHGTCVV